VVFTLAGQTVEIRKPGLFLIEADPPAVSVMSRYDFSDNLSDSGGVR